MTDPDEPTILTESEIPAQNESAAVVSGIRVKANLPYDHDGQLHRVGETFVLPPDIASRQIQQGRVIFLSKVIENGN